MKEETLQVILKEFNRVNVKLDEIDGRLYETDRKIDAGFESIVERLSNLEVKLEELNYSSPKQINPL